ncbi:hypothetical protein JCM6882_008328 [Rhodosporidiobolus microsporus]
MLPTPPLTLHPITLDSLSSPLPDDQYTPWRSSVVDAVTAVLASLPLNAPSSDVWKPHKLFHAKTAPTQTWSQGRGKKLDVSGVGETDGLRWHCRQTKVEKEQGTYAEFEEGLLRNHTRNEKEYVESCNEVEQVKVLKEGELEDTTSPASPRSFLFLLLTLPITPPSASLRSFAVVSIPVANGGPDEKHDGKHVKGRYVSVEHVQETEEGGVVWTMAVSSDPGGLVPHLLSEMAMCSKIAEDVPAFLGWLAKRRGSAAPSAAA